METKSIIAGLLRSVVWLLPVLGMVWTVAHAPDWLEPRLLTVELAPGQSLALGREALSAPQADPIHLLLRRATVEEWYLSNLSPAKQVLWQPKRTRIAQSIPLWRLEPGAAFAVGKDIFVVLRAEPRRLILQNNDQRWEYDGYNLRRYNDFLPECGGGWRTQLRTGFGRMGLPLALAQRPLRLGGGVYCADRLGVSEVPVDSAIIEPTATGFVLAPGPVGRRDSAAVIVGAGRADARSLWDQPVRLAVGDQLTVGRTRYQIMKTMPVLELALVARMQRRLADTAQPVVAPQVKVTWSRVAWWWPSGLEVPNLRLHPVLFSLLLGLAWAGLLWWRSRRQVRWWLTPLAWMLAAGCLAMYWNVLTVPVLWPYVLAWPALLVWLMSVRSIWSTRLLVVMTVLLGGGLLALLQLGAGASESGWQRYGGGAVALTGAFGWLAWGVGNSWRSGVWPVGFSNERWIGRGLRLMGAGALALLGAQIVAGDEAGWAGFQPFELVKLVLVITAAQALARRRQSRLHGWSYDKAVPWLRYLGPLLLLAAICAFALLFLHDFSPLFLLLCWSLALVWAYATAHPLPLWRRLGQLVTLVLIILLVGGLKGLHDQPEAIPLAFKTDRIQVWSAPELYPHAGYQLRRALESIRMGGWDGTFWRETTNGRVMTVPVVESDFTPTFFLNRYGGLAGLALVAMQTLFIALLVMIADRARWRRPLPPAGALTLGGEFFYFVLYGGAALLAGHFLISWGTNLGFLPVMGQPMSLLSAAGSHLVLFVLPVVALAVAIEEGSHDNSL